MGERHSSVAGSVSRNRDDGAAIRRGLPAYSGHAGRLPSESVAGMAGIRILTTAEAVELQKQGVFRLTADRIRSLSYYGNQYDPSEMVRAAKAGQLRLFRVGELVRTGGGAAGNVLIGVGLTVDIVDLSNGELSTGRFLYRRAGNAAAIGLIVTGSGGTAALVGVGVYGAEKAYDLVGEPTIKEAARINNRIERGLLNRYLDRLGLPR